MNKKLTLLFFLALVLNLPAVTYYIDSNSGNDLWDGLASSYLKDNNGPWKSLQKVSSTHFEPGDYILLKKGSVWNGGLTISSNGSPGKPIRYDTYGTGEKPIINGNGIIDFGILSNKSFITIKSIAIHNIRDQGVVFQNPKGNEDIVVEDIEITNIKIGSALIFSNGGNNILIKNSLIRNSSNAGIALMGSKENKLSNVVIENCDISHCKVNGITIHKTGEPELYTAGNNFLIRSNKSYNNGKRGYDITTGTNIIVANNISYGNRVGGYGVGHEARKVLLTKNISYNDGKVGYDIGNCIDVDVCFNIGAGSTSHQIVIGSEKGVTNNIRVYNNTFIAGNSNIMDLTGLSYEVIVKNNIFYSPEIRNIIRFGCQFRSPNYRGFKIDHNLYFSKTKDQRHFYSTASKRLFTLNYMIFYYKQDINSIFADPMFVSPQNLNFSLSSYSGAIRRGTFIQDCTFEDFNGYRYNIRKPDVGAIQANY